MPFEHFLVLLLSFRNDLVEVIFRVLLMVLFQILVVFTVSPLDQD